MLDAVMTKGPDNMRSEINKTYLINAPVERVYQQWINPENVIPPAISQSIDATVGGEYKLICEHAGKQSIMIGHFQSVIPNQALTYTWEWNQSGEVSTITVLFSPKATQTQVDLVHRGLSQQDVANHDAGWDAYIEGFKNRL